MVFVLSSKETELRERVSGMIVHSFGNEEALLRAWLKWFIEADPDAIVLFEVILSALDCRSMLPVHWSSFPGQVHIQLISNMLNQHC